MRVATVVGGLSSLAALAQAGTPEASCRHIPGDKAWPSKDEWAKLNETINGQLIKTVPMGSVCHYAPYGNYNQTECEALREGWNFRHWKFKAWEKGQLHVTHPSEVMNPYAQRRACDPFTPEDSPCELGNYAVYSINVTGHGDVIAGIKFAKEKNIRLVIKNSGHDYHGRSSGQGSLALWTYNLKSDEFIPNYKSPHYNGPAARFGAGMGVGESYMAVSKYGYRVVGGECGTVGMAGGYSQGGGHSVLASENGLGADQVLEWEVVTMEGEHLIATPEKNSDLYWALSGGGGGTYGVVVSVTVRIFKETKFSGGTLIFNDTDTPGHEVFWKGVELWYEYLPHVTANNNTAQWVLLNRTLDVQAINLPGQNVEDVHALMAPLLSKYDDLGIKYSFTTRFSETYYDHFDKYYGPLPEGAEPVTTILYARLIPRKVVQDPVANARLTDAWRQIVHGGNFIIGCGAFNLQADHHKHPDNAVLPAWRGAQAICMPNGFWDFTKPLEHNIATMDELAEVHGPLLDSVTPNSGVYMNEVDPRYRGDWKANMYGANYDRLLSIKHKYDPDHVLFGHMSVGADEFHYDDEGRLCYNGPASQEDEGYGMGEL